MLRRNRKRTVEFSVPFLVVLTAAAMFFLLPCGHLVTFAEPFPDTEEESPLKRFEEELADLSDELRKSVVVVQAGEVIERPLFHITENESYEHSGEVGRVINGNDLSGVIISDNGYVLTLFDLVKDAEYIRVETYDGIGYEGRVISFDIETNVALLKIDAEKLVPVAIAPADKVKPGTFAIKVGNAFNFERTVDFGLVNGVGRVVQIGNNAYWADMVQTSAPVNPGDIGGLLANTDGEMIGLVFSTYRQYPVDHLISQKIYEFSTKLGEELFALKNRIEEMETVAREGEQDRNDDDGGESPPVTYGDLMEIVNRLAFTFCNPQTDSTSSNPAFNDMIFAQGTNFAIGSDSLSRLIDDFLGSPDHQVRRGRIGITAITIYHEPDIDLGLADPANLVHRQGVYVCNVEPGFPAAAADIQKGDIIVALNGEKVTHVSHVVTRILNTPLDGTVELEIYRDGEIIPVTVKLSK